MTAVNVSVNRHRYCSDIARAQQEPLIGTAKRADVLIVYALKRNLWLPGLEDLCPDELPTPDTPIADAEKRAGIFAKIILDHYDGKVAFIARHSDEADGTLWIFPQKLRLEADTIQSVAQLRMVLDSALAGMIEHDAREDGEHFVMLCTHHDRDISCGVLSKPVLNALKEQADDSIKIWEVSHIGAHRYAGTLIVQPAGRYYGYIDAQIVPALLESIKADQPLVSHHRGKASLTPAEQVAENWAWSTLTMRGGGEVIDITVESIKMDKPTNTGLAVIYVTTKSKDTQETVRLTLRGEPLTFVPNSVKRGDYAFEDEKSAEKVLQSKKTRISWFITRIEPVEE